MRRLYKLISIFILYIICILLVYAYVYEKSNTVSYVYDVYEYFGNSKKNILKQDKNTYTTYTIYKKYFIFIKSDIVDMYKICIYSVYAYVYEKSNTVGYVYVVHDIFGDFKKNILKQDKNSCTRYTIYKKK